MTNYLTKIERGFHGLTASTEILLGITTEEGVMALRVTSSKRHSGQVVATATVIYKKGDGSFSTMMFQDYSKTLLAGKVARVTEKTLAEFHMKALEQMPRVLSEVAAQYNLTLAA